MRKKDKIAERTKQLRLLITRAKEDADRWGTNQKPLLLQGIEETSVFDFDIYDRAYQKYVDKRKNHMSNTTLNKANQKETDKKEASIFYSEERTQEEIDLKRIADALERIADALEKQQL